MFHSSTTLSALTLPLLAATFITACAKERDYAAGDASVSDTSTNSDASASGGGDSGVGSSVSHTGGSTAGLTVSLAVDAEVSGSDASSTTEDEAGSSPSDAGATEGAEGGVGEQDAAPANRECTQNSQCDDDNECNGIETCSDGKCKSGDVQDDGIICAVDEDQDFVCRDGNCLKSRCGDGIVDARLQEVCDDGNVTNGDGCNVDCKYSCTESAACSDGNVCNGEEACDLELHVCVAGTKAEDATECGAGRVCNDGRCVSTVCGDGVIDEGEECDDENTVEGDGCTADCQYDCEADDDCSDQNLCSGQETCDLETHTCQPGEPLTCDDNNPCTYNECEPEQGCTYPLIDADGDGQAPIVEGSDCGTDCDDDNDQVFVGAGEQCDDIDNDCDGENDQLPMLWYPDCDGDGYAPLGSEGVEQCDQPAPPANCPSGSRGTWTSRAPTNASIADCWDADPDVYPRSDAVWNREPIDGRKDYPFDYNCNNVEEKQYTKVNVSPRATCSPPVLQPVELPVEVEVELPLLNVVDSDSALPQAALLCIGDRGWTTAEAPACGKPGSFSYCSGCTRVVDEAYVHACQ